LDLVFATASTAANFRFTWGTLRGAPEYSSQRIPAATPQVGQGTDNNCLGVKFFVLTEHRPEQVVYNSGLLKLEMQTVVINCAMSLAKMSEGDRKLLLSSAEKVPRHRKHSAPKA
jgi:hypothetical protein